MTEIPKQRKLTQADFLIPSQEGLQRTISRVNEQGLLVVGSVGRSVIFNQLRGDSLHEFTARGETALEYRYSKIRNACRDVDVVGGVPISYSDFYCPHRPNNLAFKMLVRKSKTEWVFMQKSGQEILLDPMLFEPFSGEAIGNAPCVTVRAATHVALLTCRMQGSKYRKAQELLGSIIPDSEKALLESESYRKFINLLYRF